MSALMFVAVPTATCPPFSVWRQQYHKEYRSVEEASAAAAKFDANCHQYERLNLIPGGATFGADEWSDLSPSQFVARFGGCLQDSEPLATDEPAKDAQTVASEAVVGIGPSVDWRTKGQVTAVKNQGAFGTCWSFGVAENLEGLGVRQGFPLTNISEQEFISCCSNCQGRNAEVSFEWLVNTTGGQPSLEASYPYVGKPGACEAASAPRARVKLSSWGRVQDDGSEHHLNQPHVKTSPPYCTNCHRPAHSIMRGFGSHMAQPVCQWPTHWLSTARWGWG
jgi:cathepsin F